MNHHIMIAWREDLRRGGWDEKMKMKEMIWNEISLGWEMIIIWQSCNDINIIFLLVMIWSDHDDFVVITSWCETMLHVTSSHIFLSVKYIHPHLLFLKQNEISLFPFYLLLSNHSFDDFLLKKEQKYDLPHIIITLDSITSSLLNHLILSHDNPTHIPVEHLSIHSFQSVNLKETWSSEEWCSSSSIQITSSSAMNSMIQRWFVSLSEAKMKDIHSLPFVSMHLFSYGMSWKESWVSHLLVMEDGTLLGYVALKKNSVSDSIVCCLSWLDHKYLEVNRKRDV